MYDDFIRCDSVTFFVKSIGQSTGQAIPVAKAVDIETSKVIMKITDHYPELLSLPGTSQIPLGVFGINSGRREGEERRR